MTESDAAPEREAEALRARALARLPAETAARLRGAPELGAVLAEHVRSSAPLRARLAVPDDAVIDQALRLLAAGGDLDALRGFRADDFALAQACAARHPEAVRELEQRYRADLEVVLRRIDPAPARVDDALQAVRERLLLPAGDGPPKIATYAGTGPLRAWLRAVAARAAQNLRRGERPALPLDESLADSLVEDEPSPELVALKKQYRQAFREAFRAALGTLDDRAVNLLRLHYVAQTSLDRLAAMYGAHRATIARWLAHAKEQLLARTREHLKRRLAIDDAELDEVIALARSQLASTLGRALS